MGLDTSHGCWHGSYGSFDHFRTALAAAIGIDLHDMQGFVEDGLCTPWMDPADEPLVYLLDHSDCEGEIAVKALAPLAKRLREVAPMMCAAMPFAAGWRAARRSMRGSSPVEDSGDRFAEPLMARWRAAAIQFAEGCEEAAAKGEPVEFR